jgi:hypothetical protein
MLEKKDGVYCPNCHEELILDPEESAVLVDKRIPGITSSEFNSEQVLDSLISLSKKERAEIFIHKIPESEPTFGKIDGLLPESLTNALERMEITSLKIRCLTPDALIPKRGGGQAPFLSFLSSAKLALNAHLVLESLQRRYI